MTDPYQRTLATPEWLEALRVALCAQPVLANLEGVGTVTSPHVHLDRKIFRHAFQVKIVSHAPGPLEETWTCDFKWENGFHLYDGHTGLRNQFRWRDGATPEDLPRIDLTETPPDPALSECAVGRRQAERLCIVPVRVDGPYLVIALGDPGKLEEIDLGLPFRPVLASSRLSVELGLLTLYRSEPELVIATIAQEATAWVTVRDELEGLSEPVVFGTDFHGRSFSWEAFGEPRLSALGDGFGFRLFLRMTNFGPWGAVVVRVQHVGGACQLIVKRFSPPPRSDCVLQTRLLSNDRWRDLASAGEDARIWVTPGPAWRISDLGVGTVRYWHLEHWDGTRLRCSTRLAPVGGALVDFALRMLALAEVPVEVRRSRS